jgi:hypothetical protein
MNTPPNGLVLLALGLVIALGAYASYLGLQLWRQKRQRDIGAHELAEMADERAKEARLSVVVICKALLKDDLTDTEAAMRIAYLRRQVNVQADEESHYKVFEKLAEATAHIPILEDWQALERSKQRQLTRERLAVEQQFKEFIRTSATYLANADTVPALQQ